MMFRLRSVNHSPARRSEKRPRKSYRCLLEPLERRELLTASSVATGVGTNIEYSGPYSNYMPVGSGPNSYSGFSSFGNIDIPASSFQLDSGVSSINNLSLSLYNTAVSGTYAPTAGTFDVYFVPNNTTPTTGMRFGGPSGTKSGTQTGLDAIGTTTGGASTLGIDASDLVGSFNVTSSLPINYSTFTFNSLGAGAQAGITNDLNNGSNVRLIVVAHDNTGKVDWEGNYTSGNPQVQLDVNEAPLVNFGAASYSVNETDQVVGHHTVATIAVHRSGNPNSSLDIDYATSDGTAHQPTDYTAASGTLHWNAGDTSDKTFTVSFNNITTTDPSRTVNLTLTDHGGNPITPVFPTGGSTAAVSINYLQAGSVYIDQSSYAVNEADGTAAIKIDRTGSNVATSTADVTLSTANGLAYQADLQNPQDAQAGRDFGTQGNATAPTFAVHFAAGQSSAIVNVPLLDVKTFAGTRSFTASLGNVSTGTQIITPSATTVTITDNEVANSDTPNGITTHSSGVETTGPYAVDGFINLVSAPHAGFGYSTMPVITYGAGSTVFPSGYTVATVDSVKLSIYNTSTSAPYNGTPGSFDVYLLSDNSVVDDDLRYQGGTGATGPVVIGSQASPIYIGSASFPNNQVGYNDFVFDDLPTSVQQILTSDLNSGGSSSFRFAITPSQDSPVAADWEGNYFFNQPVATLLVEKTGSVVTPPPTVTGVVVDGTGWSPAYLASLQTAGLGDGHGYSIPVGSADQLKSLPYVNANQIRVTFSDDVNVQQSSLSLTGINVANYNISNFTYDSTSHTAVWTLSSTISADKLQLDLAASGAAAITGATSGVALDGDWTNGSSVYPSGDGTAGTDFDFAFNVLPGNSNQDGTVNGLDISQVASNWLHVGGFAGDVNGDNVVNGLDISAIASNWLKTLPAGSGNASVTASVAALPASPGVTAAPAGASVDHTAAFVSAPTPASVDQVMAQQTVANTSTSGHVAAGLASLTAHSAGGGSGTSATESLGSIDDQLLSTLASAGRNGRNG